MQALVDKFLPGLDNPTNQYVLTAIQHYAEESFSGNLEPSQVETLLTKSLTPFVLAFHPQLREKRIKALGSKEILKQNEHKAKEIITGLIEDCLSDGILSRTEYARKQQLRSKQRAEIAKKTREREPARWGVEDLNPQLNYNRQVDSISDALSDSKKQKNLEKLRKQQEKDQKKQDALFEKEIKRIEADRIADRKELEDNLMRIAEYRLQDNSAAKTNVKDIQIDSFSMYVGNAGSLLDDTTIKIVHGKKYAFLGVNGSGKSTLLRHISRGKIEKFPEHISIMHVEQEMVVEDKVVVEAVLDSDIYRTKLLHMELDLQSKLKEKHDDELSKKLTWVYAELESVGSSSAESRARKILSGLGFDQAMQDMSVTDLSGGWKMRVALCCALFIAPDLLLLDEPTNHLDLEACVWLEKYLLSYPKTVVVVSHDRKFLNNIVDEVISLDNKKLKYYKGDIDMFERTRDRLRLEQKREFEAQALKMNHMQEFIDKFRANAKRASMVQSRIKALNKMEKVENVEIDAEFTFEFPEPRLEVQKLAEVQHVWFKYHAEGEYLLKDVDFSIHAGRKIALNGPNGSGKSTLLNLIVNMLRPQKGYVEVHPKTKIAYFAQHHLDTLNPRQTPLEFFCARFVRQMNEKKMKQEDVRRHLGRYGVSQTLADKKILKLSGGQKSRVAFALCTFENPNLLILDEPTNHLDLETVEALIGAVNKFTGGVIYVSHDQNFIEKTADEIYCFHDQKFMRFKGSFEEYKTWALKRVDG